MTHSCNYLDTYVLQQDIRVRIPKVILSNICVEKGKTKFDIYLDSKKNTLIFSVQSGNSEGAGIKWQIN